MIEAPPAMLDRTKPVWVIAGIPVWCYAAPETGQPIWEDGRCRECGAQACVVVEAEGVILGRWCAKCDPWKGKE
jgi:hypothetical protein